MSTPAVKVEAAIPGLDNVYSGVPSRLADVAVTTKARLDSQRTVLESTLRKTISLPPGINKKTFDDAISELKASLGSDHVEVNEKPLVDGWYMQHPCVHATSSIFFSSLADPYSRNTHDAFHIVDQDDLTSSAAVYPSSTAEVQVVVRWANKHKIPIYPISMGRNLG